MLDIYLIQISANFFITYNYGGKINEFDFKFFRYNN